MSLTLNKFDLTGKTALVTGAGGLLGPKHAEALLDCGAKVILTDYDEDKVRQKSEEINEKYGMPVTIWFRMDVTNKEDVLGVVDACDKIDILINNASLNPKVEKGNNLTVASRFETMTEEYFRNGIEVDIMGCFNCSQAFIQKALKNNYEGVILNVASSLSKYAPDNRLYFQEGLSEEEQNKKPIYYAVAKHAVVGMTQGLASEFAHKGIRVNAISPGGVQTKNHPQEFVDKYSYGVLQNRMASVDEYKATVAYLCSDASAYMTGQNILIDGGRGLWR